MQRITGEWIAKAEGDFATARRELKAIDQPNYDAVCFHAQQCAEKYLKAFLQDADIAFPKTHDLADLLSSAILREPTWVSMTTDLNTLSAFAVEYRYPGDSADLAEAKEAFEICENVRQAFVEPFIYRKAGSWRHE